MADYSPDGFLLSPQQRHLWSLQDGGTAFHAHCVVLLKGTLQTGALEEALHLLVERHDNLRFVLRRVPEVNTPLQFIQEHGAPSYHEVDLSGLGAEEQEARAAEIAAQEKRHAGDWKESPSIRFVLLTLAPDTHRLLVTLPALCADAQSMRHLVLELAALYDLRLRRAEPSDEAVQYVQFAEWQNELLTAPEDEGGEYWTARSDLGPAPVTLPFDADPLDEAEFVPEFQGFAFDEEIGARLDELARRHRLSLESFLLTCWQILVRRLSGRADAEVGYVHHGRKFEELNEALGLFAKALPFRAPFDAGFRFGDAWAETARHVEEASEWAEYFNQDRLNSFDEEGRALPRYIPFQFEFEEGAAVQRVTGLTLHVQQRYSHFDRFGVKLVCALEDGRLGAGLHYNSRKLGRQDVARLAGQFQTLVRAAASETEAVVGRLDILSPLERELIFGGDAAGARDLPQGLGVHQLFEEQARLTPDGVALVFEDSQLTYGELNRRANQLAHYLRRQGVGPEVLVGIFVERSLDMIVSLLGVLKAGGAYVSLDPKYPVERISLVLREGGIALLLTHAHLFPEDSATDGLKVMRLEAVSAEAAEESTQNPSAAVAPEQAAYVSYTSGSTGSPKGVVIEHRQLLNYTSSIIGRLALPAGASYATVSTIAADLGNTVIYPSLCGGGLLHVISWDRLFDAEAMAEYFERHRPDCLKIVPSHMKALLDVSNPEALMPRRRLVLGGESLSWDLARQLQTLAPACTIVNHYGPTETTVGVLTCQLDAGCEPPFAATPPLGRPLDGIRVYILDSDLQPVPFGVVGELYISGAGLARGYLGRPRATAEKFIPNPYGSADQSRMYRTGDLARYLQDGAVEFLGRGDNQIKVRGFRVELNEIALALRGLPGLRDAVVLAPPDESSGHRIVAYVITEADHLDAARPEVHDEQLSEWRMVFNETHSELAEHQKTTFNTFGWNSSYTEGPFPEAEIREQVDHTVKWILSSHPSRVLEIGCGTGLLLFAIAPSCREYYATDFSEEILSYTRQVAAASGLEPGRLQLLQRMADDFEGLPEGAFDAVVLNSVVQYFPSLDYLIGVLEGAAKVTRPGGSIFVGDVRSLPLLHAFHASVQFARAVETTGREQLQVLTQHQLDRDSELVLDPSFFYALRRRIPEIGRVELTLKRGRSHNELTKFRYNVRLFVGAERPPGPGCSWLDWQREGLTVAALRELLQRESPAVIGLSRVPNARLLADLRLAEMIAATDGPATAAELKEVLEVGDPAGVDPEEIWALEAEVPYEVEISWSVADAAECFDVLLRRKTVEGASGQVSVEMPRAAESGRPLAEYANVPLREKLVRNLLANVRASLAAQLPDYMLPSAFVPLRKFPLTHNGKVDTAALALLDQVRSEHEGPFVEPRTAVEVVVASVWAEVLRLERISVNDNFFELGGHSLLATQVVARLRNVFQMTIPLRSLFESPTVAGLAAAITANQEKPGQVERIAELLQQMEDVTT